MMATGQRAELARPLRSPVTIGLLLLHRGRLYRLDRDPGARAIRQRRLLRGRGLRAGNAPCLGLGKVGVKDARARPTRAPRSGSAVQAKAGCGAAFVPALAMRAASAGPR